VHAALAVAAAAAAAGALSVDGARGILFDATGGAAPGACRDGADAARVDCLVRLRFAGDPAAAALAADLWARFGWLAGTEPAHTMDGGWRGIISIVPEPPRAKHRRHLEWIGAAAKEFDAFFAGIAARAPAPPAGPARPAYRWRDLAFRFFRSVKKATPSAYALDWTISYNVSGSLFRSAAGVRNTLFHEIFHLNDQAHGHFASAALAATFDAIVARCAALPTHAAVDACYAPYAPFSTKVIGGTYYAFQPGGGVQEYAAELAVRWYADHRAILAGAPRKGRAFKCGPPANVLAWRALVDEFFAGVDLVPPCPGPR